MTEEIANQYNDIAIRVSDTDFQGLRKKPTLSIRKGNQITKIASFNNQHSMIKFMEVLCTYILNRPKEEQNEQPKSRSKAD